MDYFKISVNPLYEESSDVIVVKEFHPLWKKGAAKLLEGKIKKIMQEYAEKIIKWSNVQMNIDFSEGYRLNHINIPFRGGLHLDFKEEKYRSHNINSFLDAGAILPVIIEYINWLNFAIEKIIKK